MRRGGVKFFLLIILFIQNNEKTTKGQGNSGGDLRRAPAQRIYPSRPQTRFNPAIGFA